MDYQKLGYFFYAAHYRNFSKAAELCNVTQATISRQIQALEDEIGVPLFFRTKHGVALTNAGRYLFSTLPSFMQQHQDIIAGCRKAADKDYFRIRIAAGPYEHLLLKQPLSIFMSKYANSEADIITYTYNVLASGLYNQTIDFVFCTENCANANDGIVSAVIYSKPWQVIAHRDSPFWSLPELQQKSLQGQKIITTYKNAYEPVEPYCKKNHLRQIDFIETNFLHAQLLMLNNKSTIAIVPPFVKSSLPEDIRMEDVLDEPFCPNIVAAYNPMSPYQGNLEFLDICKKHFADS